MTQVTVKHKKTGTQITLLEIPVGAPQDPQTASFLAVSDVSGLKTAVRVSTSDGQHKYELFDANQLLGVAIRSERWNEGRLSAQIHARNCLNADLKAMNHVGMSFTDAEEILISQRAMTKVVF